MYSEKVLDHFTNPRNVGEIPDADGVGEVGNARCGDIMKMYIQVEDGVIPSPMSSSKPLAAALPSPPAPSPPR